jgi:hypothetical protein
VSSIIPLYYKTFTYKISGNKMGSVAKTPSVSTSFNQPVNQPVFDMADIIIISILVGVFVLGLVGLSLYFMHLQMQDKSIAKNLNRVNHLHTIENALRKVVPQSVQLPFDDDADLDTEGGDTMEHTVLRHNDAPIIEYPRKTEYDRRREVLDDVMERTDRRRPPIQMIPINIPTRGIDEFRQIGVISSVSDGAGSDDAGSDAHGKKRILPLYGRRTYNGSSKWNYYTSTDGYHVVQLSVTHKNKDCMQEYGCDELYSGDDIYIQEYDEVFRVNMYQRSPIRYIPYV